MLSMGKQMHQCKTTIKSLLLITLLLLLTLQAYSQREADRWYFGYNCGLDFSAGIPLVVYDGKTHQSTPGVGIICDSLSNLLFYGSFDTIYTSQHTEMENGSTFIAPGGGTQSNLIVPWPESDSLFYMFKFDQQGLYYNIIDMSKNDGLGAVIEKDVPLMFAWDAHGLLTAAKHKNKRDIWIITRKFIDDNYAVFLITPEGINETPSLYYAPDLRDQDATLAQMKISYDKKYLIASYQAIYSFEVCNFDAETGEIDFLYIDQELGWKPTGLEFSPDSKFAYISYHPPQGGQVLIKQHDMEYIQFSSQFFQSGIDIGTEIGGRLQLATDGKIYCTGIRDVDPQYYIGIIHKPWESGTACQYERYAINMYPDEPTSSMPNILMDYLYRFEFDGYCEGEPFQFTSNFNPVPSSISWDFGDVNSGSNNFSNDLNPTHLFSNGGIYEVSVDVWYPSGRFEHTSRKVEVEYGPEPDLGPDTAICSGQQIVLNAECGPHSYTWSTGQFGSSQITVSDSGWYWVRVINDIGCFKIDSIYVGYHQSATADITSLVISPTTCGGSTGVIRGIIISGNPPLSYQWVDDMGNPIGTTIDIYNLAVGNYTLQVTDNNCITEIGPFTIYDAGDVLIQQVDYTQEYCEQQDGSITVTAISGLGDMLFYSIDNGATYYSNLGIFTGLPSGSYVVRVRDSSDCQSVYINNPVIIQNIVAPEILDVQVGNASVGMSDGSIEITASGGSDTLFYSNDNGINFQINDGGFYNLAAGSYTCVVKDEIGCDTIFIVEVPEEVTIRLQAVAGDDEVCPGNSTFVPLIVSDFNDVRNFKTTLTYNEELLTCLGFANAHPELVDSLEVLLFPAEEKVELYWASTAITLPDNTIIADLVFQAIDPGLDFIEWDESPGASLFQNSTGLIIPVDYYFGIVKIYSEVFFSFYGNTEVCQGETLNLQPDVWTSNGDVTYLWTHPNGDTSTAKVMEIINVQLSQSGIYSLTVTDTVDCWDDGSVDVIIYLNPYPEFTVQDTIFTDDPFDLDAGAGFVHYLWNTGDTTQFIWVDEKGWYAAEVESIDGCIGEDSSYVVFSTVLPPELIKISFPNAFTPNGDGLNDEFKPVTNSTDIEHFSLSIYNRWGALVYQTSDITQGWNGTYKGELCQAGAYVYKIAYRLAVPPNTVSEVKMGTVMLIR